MSKLYSDLSEVYEMMYQTFINYDEEYRYYKSKLNDHNIKSVIELGCGTAHMAGRFIADSFDYTGIDLHNSMLEIAKNKYPEATFIQADMRSFRVHAPKDACVLTGRTSAYLLSNNDILNCLQSINNSLNPKGIVCFDAIDAGKFIPLIRNGYQVRHEAVFGQRKFLRESYWSLNGEQSWTFNWDSVYFEEENGNTKEIGRDSSVIRSFTKDEINLMLKLSGFTVREMEDRASYAFDTFVVVAQKI